MRKKGFVRLAILFPAFATLAASAGEIHWRSGVVPTQFTTSEQAAQSVSAAAAQRDGRRRMVVQFDAPLTEAEKIELALSGVQLLGYLGDHAYFASVGAAGLDGERLAGVEKLRAAMPVEREWKLHPSLVRDEIMPWAMVGADPAQFEANPELAGQPIKPQPGEDPVVAAYVLFHPDVNLDLEGVGLAVQHGAVVRDYIRSLNGLVIELPYRQIATLADEDAVQYVEPPLPKFSTNNSSNRALTGANEAQAAPYNLDGSGVSVLVYDGGTALASHADFGGRVRVGDSSGLSDHATHVSGTVGGSGANSAGLHRGMAPGVQIESYGFETGGPLEAGFLYTNPGDLEADYNDAINNHGADISNNSIGTNVAANGFPCSWEGDYGTTSALIDAIVRGSLGQPFRIVWAGGNERGNGRCGTTYNTTAPPAGAKNHLCIGALNSNNDSVTTFSSWGPTDDGRLKPDFAAPGCEQGGDGGVTSTSSAGSYNVKCGTSMASPTACGLAALILQDFRASYPDLADFRNSTLKAVFAQTAVDIESVGPDFRSGYGSIRVVPAVDLMRAGNFLEAEVTQDDTVQVLVIVSPSDTQLKVTLAWDDVPGTPNVNPALVNDLDLLVLDAATNSFFPWTLNPASPATAAVRTQPDHVNNIEQVVIDNPPPGSYIVRIHGFNVPQGPQSFSLAAEPLLINCSPQGVVKFHKSSYQCQDSAIIAVNDCDVNTNDLVAETITITVASDTEPGGELLVLTETGPQTALFVGTIGLDTINTDGVLQVTEGDTITATYIDADDGFGGTNVVVISTVGVDCTPPVVSNVATSNVDPRSARVTFNTDEIAAGQVHYGTDCGDLNSTAGAFGFNTAHTIELTSLTDDTTYFFGVEATDPAGNVAFDTNGGACYTFTTPEIPDFFTQLFLSDFDLHNRALLFAPNGSIDYYGVCSYETVALPTDPAGGTNVVLNDSGSFQLNLTGGAQVLLYGTSYSTLWINANGNITFDAADSDQTESIADHFDQPRVSVLFDDLDPAEGGTVSYKQLSDRVVVTWLNVPEDGAGNQNTFQVELYFDGRIQLTWLNIAASDGLAGLSQGLGIPVDFFETDLSEFGDCGPRPPSAAGRTVETGQDRPVAFELLASDDGEPDPPGEITYIVLSLPTYELRDAGSDHVIVPGDLPYTLAGDGNVLIYTPSNGFLGIDSFDFKVNDGGVPPDGGDSNVATVSMKVDPVLTVPIYDPFPQTTFDAGKWALIVHATIDDVGIDEPSPPYSARLNGNPVGGDEMRTQMIDLGSLPSARLHYAYQRTGGGESPDAGENLRVEYINSTGTWALLTQYAGDGPDMVVYIKESILLPEEALHDSFRVRFRNTGTASTSNFDDWFVDDFAVTAGDGPIASGLNLTVGQGEPADITLLGTDPNESPLDYIVVSLPAGGSLTDPNGGVIDSNSLPYTLIAGGDTVTYQPDAQFLGGDTFEFKVSNGLHDSFVVAVNIFVEPVLELPFEDQFPDVVFDELKWAVVSGTTIDDLGLGIPSPPYAARFNGSPNGGDDLISFMVDLEGQTDINLSYYWQRTGGGDSPEANEDLFVEYQDSNGAWQEIARYLGSGPDMVVFELHDAPLPAEALHASFRIRFRNIGSPSVSDDWFVDNVRVYSIHAPTAFNLTMSIPKFGWGNVTFVGTDPTNDPLEFLVVSLPAVGELYDSGDGTRIEAGMLPYALSGDQALYLPPLGYTGSQSFGYRANDGEHNSNLATVSIEVGGVQSIYFFPMDTDPGWSTQGLWQWGVPQGIDFDPTSGFTGSNVYGYNLAGKYENNLPATYLTTTAMDLSIVENATLEFYRWLGVESSFFDQARLEISNNGVNWSLVWAHSNVAGTFDREWKLQTYDISAVADQQSTVYLRWSMGPTDSSGQFEGWNIDDVRITGDVLAGPGDIDKDGDVDGADLRAFGACMFGPDETPSPAAPMTAADCLEAFDFDLDGDIDLRDFEAFLGVYTGP